MVLPVLGAIWNHGDATPKTSIDDYSTPGIWSFNNTVSGLPSGVQGGLFVVIPAGMGGGGVPIFKVLFCAYPAESAGIYYKGKWGAAYGDWIKLQ